MILKSLAVDGFCDFTMSMWSVDCKQGLKGFSCYAIFSKVNSQDIKKEYSAVCNNMTTLH